MIYIINLLITYAILIYHYFYRISLIRLLYFEVQLTKNNTVTKYH